MFNVTEMKNLCAMFDKIDYLHIHDRCTLLVKMYGYVDLVEFARPETEKLIRMLKRNRDYDNLELLSSLLSTVNIVLKVDRPPTLLYDNEHNVHAFTSTTMDVAKRLVTHHTAAEYYRPSQLSGSEYDHFFMMIEQCTCNGVDPRQIFAAVWRCVAGNSDYTERLKQELIDSRGTCLVGCIGRMINALRGLGFDEYETVMDTYEHERCVLYHQLTTLLTGTDPDDIAANIQQLINCHAISPSDEYGFRILSEYSGVGINFFKHVKDADNQKEKPIQI